MSSRFVRIIFLISFASLLSFKISLVKIHAQDDGPRAYWVNPVGTNEIGAYARWIYGNQISGSGSIYHPEVVSAGTQAALDYTRTFTLFNRSATANVDIYLANIRAEVEADGVQYTRGHSDLSWQFTLNLFESVC